MNLIQIVELEGVTKMFGGLVAVRDLGMTVTKGTIHGLIGPNGAGKSTVFDLISGLTPVTSGKIALEGRDITNVPVESRVVAGVCRTFQTPKLFENMTALEVVMTGCHRHARCGFASTTLSLWKKSRDEAEVAKKAHQLLALVGLENQAEVAVNQLPYGARRLIEIARALATEPKLLLLDEVASGLNPVETTFVARLVKKLRNRGLTIVLVEHDMRFIMGICDRVTVLNFGAKIAEGTPDEVIANDDVVAAYLGRPRPDALSRRNIRRSGAAGKQDLFHD